MTGAVQVSTTPAATVQVSIEKVKYIQHTQHYSIYLYSVICAAGHQQGEKRY